MEKYIENQCIKQLTESSKIVLVYGPRQAGKTTLVKQIAEKTGLKTLFTNADLTKYETMFSNRDVAVMQSLTDGCDIKLEKTKIKAPKTWIEAYNGSFSLINRNTYLNWLL